MFFFENNFSDKVPPMPCTEIEVRISTENDAKSIIARVILDTGADITVIPAEQLDEIFRDTHVDYDQITIEGYRSWRIPEKAYYVNISINGCPPIVDRVIKGGEKVGILGRNVSNHFITHLDGPSLNWLMKLPDTYNDTFPIQGE